ncbi:MAG TPA: hypothetical protein VIC81_01080 [Acidimicrobiales bacterium]
MRSLILVRHAKAVPAGVGASDVERALHARGVAQCAQLRRRVSDPDDLGRYGPTLALVSAAARTRETFELAFAGTSFVDDVTYSPAIYNGQRDVSADDLLAALAAIDTLERSLLVVAHNPSVAELLWALTGEVLRDGYPTAGLCVIGLHGAGRVDECAYELVERVVPD